MVACIYVIILILQAVAVNSQNPAILSVTNVIPGATATFECSLPSLTSSTTFDIKKDNVYIYQCINIAFACSMTSSDTDYSDVGFTDLGTAAAKGTFTVANADQTRDGGDWTCKYGSSLISSTETFVVSAPSPATLSVTRVLQGATATFECSYPNLESPTSLDINKDSGAVYTCADIASTCSKSSSDNDYSDVTFTGLDTASAKGTFTVANADQTRDGGGWTCKYGTSLISSSVTFVVTAQSPAKLNVINVIKGETATFECSYPNLESPTTLDIYKDNVALYTCTDIALACSKSSSDNDYSDVTFTALGTALAKGTFTVANADQTRDGGEWTCKYGTSLISPPVIFVVTDDSWCSSNIGSCLGAIFGGIIACILVVLLVVWCCFLGQKTAHHIGYMTIEKVTHDSIQLRWSMDGLPPKTPGLKAKSGEQQPKAGHEMDGKHTVTVENMAPDTIITIYLEYTKMDGTHCKEMLMQIQTMKDHIRDMTIQKVNRDTIHLRWSMNGGHPITPGLKAICGIQHPRVCHETDGTHTVTVENLAPDTSNTIYLEYTNKGGTHYKEKLIRTQTLKAPTGKPKGLPPLKTNRVPATYTPKPGQDGEDTYNGP